MWRGTGGFLLLIIIFSALYKNFGCVKNHKKKIPENKEEKKEIDADVDVIWWLMAILRPFL